MNTYALGKVVRIHGTFTNQAGLPVNPATVTFKIKSPLAAVTTYIYGTDAEVIKDSDGNYHVDYKPNRQGVWGYGSFGTGTNETAAENSFQIAESQFD